jgi:hypothetical protein
VRICLTINREGGIGRILIVSLMVVLWLATAAVAASPELHHRLHRDSKSVTHECVVTLFSKSYLLNGSTSSFVLALIPVFFGLFLLLQSFRFSIIDYRLSPSRMPPANPFHTAVVG